MAGTFSQRAIAWQPVPATMVTARVERIVSEVIGAKDTVAGARFEGLRGALVQEAVLVPELLREIHEPHRRLAPPSVSFRALPVD